MEFSAPVYHECLCVCATVCEREGEKKRERARARRTDRTISNNFFACVFVHKCACVIESELEERENSRGW